MLDEMSADSFINGFRNPISIRGIIKLLRCDQGTNFTGAKNELKKALKEMDPEVLKSRLADFDCQFEFNSPYSSHKGGVWERQIRTIRSILTGLLDQHAGRLDSSSLRTYFYEVMAIVNSKPLTATNLNDPTGPDPLTPNMLLTMKSGVIVPPPGSFSNEDIYSRKRWRVVQGLANEFSDRWRKEYLQNLQARSKWNKISAISRQVTSSY